jgi:hypothetical protein
VCDGIAVDYNGDNEAEAPGLGNPLDAYPGGVLTDPDDIEDCRCCDDGNCERFTVDSNEDGVQDSCDVEDGEEPNDPCEVRTCCSPYGCIDLCLAAGSCGSGTVTPVECFALGGIPIMNTDTECLVACSNCPPIHLGTLGVQASGPNLPSLPLHDGIYTPGERFRDVNQNGRYDALYEPPFDANEDGDCDYPGFGDGTDFLDTDDDAFDQPEPFEDFLVRWNCAAFGGLGNWVPVSRDYIYSNYPLNPDWDFEEELDTLVASLDYGSCDASAPAYTSDDPFCLYIKMEMYRVRGLGDYADPADPQTLFSVDDDAVAAWTNVDEMAYRFGNGVYDPPERFRDTRAPDGGAGDDARVSTKMQQLGEAVITPRPGNGGGLDTVDWYEDFWRGRYGSEPPLWITGST